MYSLTCLCTEGGIFQCCTVQHVYVQRVVYTSTVQLNMFMYEGWYILELYSLTCLCTEGGIY